MRSRTCTLLAAVALLMAPFAARAGESVLEGLEREIRAVVDGAGPAVVRVTARAKTEGDEEGTAGRMLPFLVRSSRVGTGILVSSDGIVLTSRDVAKGAKAARVQFPGGEERDGVILGSDDYFQVAVVKIDPVPDVDPLEFAEGGAPLPGSLGILLGNADGRSRSISLGIVTGRRQSGHPFTPFDNYLIVNAPVQPGDAGGPLLDRRGRVVGMSVGPLPMNAGFRVSPAPGAGIRGFPGTGDRAHVVPASDLRFALREIREHGRIRHGSLGIVLKTKSLEIRDVRPGSPAAEAGLLSRDVFVEVRGQEVRDAGRLSHYLRRAVVEEPLPMTVLRDGERVEVAPRLEEVVPGREPLVAGIAITSVNGRVVLASVRGRLADAGVHPGDVLIALNGEKVTDAETVLKVLFGAKDGDSIRLTLSRRGEPVEVLVTD